MPNSGQKEVRKSKKNITSRLNNTINKRINEKMNSSSKKRYSIFAKNRKLQQVDYSLYNTNNKSKKSKSNNKITKYLERIRSSRIKEYNNFLHK